MKGGGKVPSMKPMGIKSPAVKAGGYPGVKSTQKSASHPGEGFAKGR